MSSTTAIPPEADIELARRCGATFYVATKAGRGMPWTRVSPPADLVEACAHVANLHDVSVRDGELAVWEIAMFMLNAGGSGTLYWSSRYPDVYNSIVLSASRFT